GTTGVPKCIVHGAGGVLLKHHVEQKLLTDLGREDVFFYFTTCGWMMWNWLVSGLAQGCTLVLYDGSPVHPAPDRIFQLAQDTGITVLGTSPKFLSGCEKAGLRPRERYPLPRLRTLLSTGSPLEPGQFRYVYANIKSDLQLASIAGGTDLVGCFMGGNPFAPVYAGEIQGLSLGMDVAAYDDQARPVRESQGELVCRQPFPSMPVYFWHDPDNAKYRSAYFTEYPGAWRHGDFIAITARGGVIVYGRSDATLNPGGVRIGTAEIYRIVEGLPFVRDSIVVGLNRGGDVQVVLFVVLAEGRTLDAALEQELRAAIRAQATARHVPAIIRQIREVPTTINGKKVELAVAALLQGRTVKNQDALANPEALKQFQGLALE
ncbi:MAG: acetoacetate--CoA ligase, partial [Deltaproteobacteria bacterium]|nr:acetoacetate--CoA ligase [Deltaproteobacteria bacterium]